MNLHLDLHLVSRLKSLGRAVVSRFSKHDERADVTAAPAPEPVPPSARPTIPMSAKRPAHTPSDGVPAVDASPEAITVRTSGELSPDQLAYGADAFHEEDPEALMDDDQLDDGRTWNEELATRSIESGPVDRRPLRIDSDGTIH